MTELPAQTAIGIDVGGTYTDLFLYDANNRECSVVKVVTDHAAQANGIEAGLNNCNVQLNNVGTIVHGTTVGTNALLQRTGARVGLITTKGFGDVLEMRRRDRPQTWGLWGHFDPIIPRHRRLEVEERTLSDGKVIQPVDKDEIKEAGQRLLDMGAESVVVFFINSYANQQNETYAGDILREIWPNEYVSTSSELLPEIREYERASTSAINAYLQPIIGPYLTDLGDRLHRHHIDTQILVVQSNGGLTSTRMACREPVRTTLSGPAAGVIGAAYIAHQSGYDNVITCDMGGTSFDVSLIANGSASMVAETAIDFGMVTRSPMIEIVTIGAGGGSIANLDAGGILEIGPESAGSEPGPACYGKGNGTPTVTDANLVLGRINPLTPIGVGIGQLDLDAAKRAIVSHIAKPLGLDLMAAADAIIRVANSKMAGAIRLVSIERGYQPEAFVLMPFGGGGALHAGALIKDVGLSKAVIPRYPGATSAFGCVVADIRLDRVKTINTLLEHLDINRLNEESERLHLDGMRNLEASQLSVKELTVYLELDMNYVGQTHTITVQLPQNPVSVGFIRKAFEQTYRRIYSDVLEGIPVRVLNMRIVMIGKRPEFDLSLFLNAKVESTQTKTIKQRDVWVEGEWQSVRVYQRNQLNAGTVIVGPALIEQNDATVFVDDKLTGTADTFGNLTLELQ